MTIHYYLSWTSPDRKEFHIGKDFFRGKESHTIEGARENFLFEPPDEGWPGALEARLALWQRRELTPDIEARSFLFWDAGPRVDVEHLTDMLHTLKLIANELGTDTISFGVCNEAVEALAQLPGTEVQRTLYRLPDQEPYVIESIEVQQEGMRFRAQSYDRPPTKAELVNEAEKEKREYEAHYVMTDV
jgi:hypothetical protein